MELGIINTPEITAVSTMCIHVTMQVLTILVTDRSALFKMSFWITIYNRQMQ